VITAPVVAVRSWSTSGTIAVIGRSHFAAAVFVGGWATLTVGMDCGQQVRDMKAQQNLGHFEKCRKGDELN
jgi:hypothetical protein